MADESDSGSVQSVTSDQSAEKKQNDTKRYYALYTFYPNRPRSVGDASSVEGEASSEDGNLSLSIAATNLSASAETDLRKSLAQRLSKSPCPCGEGNFLPVGLSSTEDVSSSAACYFCVLKTSSSSDTEDSTATNLRRFVVCFISFSDSSLDQFRRDLDSYAAGLVKLLDAELSQLNTGVKTYLEAWHETVLDYITRCMNRLGDQVQYLIYSALVDATLQISGATATDEEDIKKFVNCCSLSPLLEQLQASDQQKAGISASGETWQVQPNVISLTLTEQGATFDTQGIESCNFCKLAADHLTAIDAKNVTKLRDSLESVKLAFIHNLNKLKRFLHQAEVDHYALYRAYVFLKKCGAGNLLLRYVKLDASPETLSVLAAIEEFIQDKQVQLA